MSEQPALVSRAESGDPYDTPPLATCSYWEYQRGMGTATRITRMAPRGVPLPDPRWTGQRRWPDAALLAPGRDYFHKGLSPEEFRDRYLADLNRIGGKAIAAALRAVPVEDGRIVLLCFEKTAVAERECHRRVFAGWWQELTGREVPELIRHTGPHAESGSAKFSTECAACSADRARSDPDASFFAPTFFDQPITP